MHQELFIDAAALGRTRFREDAETRMSEQSRISTTVEKVFQYFTKEECMIIVRNCFVAKPGNASKLAAQLKEAAAAAAMPRHRVLTDLTGEFNRVILEYEAENIREFEDRMKDYATNQVFRDKMKGYTDLWVTGSREILQLT
jgi:hypothetical protein